jgi:RNA-directed DNA polymerase
VLNGIYWRLRTGSPWDDISERYGPAMISYNRFCWRKERGVGLDRAARTAGSPHGPWRISNSPALVLTFPNAFFAAFGLPSLARRRIRDPHI